MKAFLMYPDQDFVLRSLSVDELAPRSYRRGEQTDQPFPAHQQALIQDLELNLLFQVMSVNDEFILEVVQKGILSGSNDLDVIHYRQSILKDCLKHPAIVREIYHIPIEAADNKRKHWRGIYGMFPSGILSSAVDLLQMFMGLLKRLKQIADEYAGQFESAGFTRFFAMIQEELDDDYFATIQDHLKELQFRDGVLLSAVLGKGNEGDEYILRKPNNNDLSWKERIFAKKPPVYSFRIHPRDDNGARAVSALKNRGVNLVANAVAQSADHINSFLNMLRNELAFYIGCLNLSEQLTQMGAPIAFPVPVSTGERQHTFQGLYDVCLALTMKKKCCGQ